MTRIFVDGAYPPLAGPLVEHLLAQGNDVALYSHAAIPSRLPSPSVRPEGGAFTMYDEQVSQQSIVRAVRDYQPEVVYQLAYHDPPCGGTENNVVTARDSFRLLEAARAVGTSRVIMVESLACLEALPREVGHSFWCRTDRYAVEVYLRSYAAAYSLEWVSLAFGTIYGPDVPMRSHDEAPHTMASHMLKKQPVLISGTGRQSHDYLHQDDALAALLNAWRHGPGR